MLLIYVYSVLFFGSYMAAHVFIYMHMYVSMYFYMYTYMWAFACICMSICHDNMIIYIVFQHLDGPRASRYFQP